MVVYRFQSQFSDYKDTHSLDPAQDSDALISVFTILDKSLKAHNMNRIICKGIVIVYKIIHPRFWSYGPSHFDNACQLMTAPQFLVIFNYYYYQWLFINQMDFQWSISIDCIDSIDCIACTVYSVIATGWSRWVTKKLFLVALVPNFNQCPVLGSCYRFFSMDQYYEPYLVCRTEDLLPSSILVTLSSPRKSCQTRTLW